VSAVKPPSELLEDAINQIRGRRDDILNELREIEEALQRYGIDPHQLANAKGRTLVQGSKGGAEHAPVAARAVRRRRIAPSLDWLVSLLREGKQSQPNLERRASSAGFSETAAVALLKKHGNRFKSERSPRKPGMRGNPALIWSLRGR